MNIFLNNLKIQLSNIDVSKLETFKKLVLNLFYFVFNYYMYLDN
jgi:hypothetical protein